MVTKTGLCHRRLTFRVIFGWSPLTGGTYVEESRGRRIPRVVRYLAEIAIKLGSARTGDCWVYNKVGDHIWISGKFRAVDELLSQRVKVSP
jgi:hypothetical protein